ncbi:MAG: TonB-dependent receptor plug domain-containing protein, partial [Bacteroidales bacterium]|nr:TonB-dependent receptor plug domain-containing protein [Bacteroidales bacterium]
MVLNSSGITYKVMSNNVVVLIPSVLQQNKVTGTVTDASTGEPVIGANIIVEGTTVGTISDGDGKFNIDIPKPESVLLVSFLGYNTERISVNGQNSFEIKLVPDITQLQEIVVVGYGTQKKVNVTGSVATLDGKKIERVPVANTTNTLVGRLPGLIAVNRSGEPGYDDASLSIRGFSNMLVIVDGVEQSFNQIDPNEIENISILKRCFRIYLWCACRQW